MVRRNVLPRAFYDRDPVTVTQALLGKQLVREDGDGVVTGLIIETEAYLCRLGCAVGRRMGLGIPVVRTPPGMASAPL